MTVEKLAYVYVIGPDEGPQKVGVTGRVDRRLSEIQTSHPARVRCHHAEPASRSSAAAVENYAHWLLNDRRLRGEWFNVSPSDAVAAVQKATHAVKHGMSPAWVSARRTPPPPPAFLDVLAQLGYTPSQAAQAVGTTTRTVQSIVAGQREATRTMAIALHQHAQLVAAGIEERVPAIRRGPKKAA